MSRAVVVVVLAGLAACNRGEDVRPQTPIVERSPQVARPPPASRDCGSAQGDSARAVCLALNEVERMGSTDAEAYGIARRGDTICVHTWPDPKRHPGTVDGEGAVEVVHGRVIASLLGDSVPCPGDRAAALRGTPGPRSGVMAP